MGYKKEQRYDITEPIDPTIRAFVWMRGKQPLSPDHWSLKELGLTPISQDDVVPGNRAFYERCPLPGAGLFYYPVTFVRKPDGQIGLSPDISIPSFPPGCGKRHKPGSILLYDETYIHEQTLYKLAG